MIKTIITLAVSLVFANQSYAEENIEELIQEGVTFYASFDGQINADRAAGANKPNNIYGKKINYIDGVKGKALNGDNERIMLAYRIAENIDFSKSGTLSMWIKPVSWATTANAPQQTNTEFKKIIVNEFFLTSYQKTGYIVLQRMTGNTIKRKDTLGVFFPSIPGIKASCRSEIDWNLDEWHNVVLTWNPMIFKLFIDGSEKGKATLQRKIENTELSSNFAICCPAGTAIDEFIIYDHELSDENIAKFYDFTFKGIKK